MGSVVPHPPTTPLSELFQDCVAVYGKLLISLEHDASSPFPDEILMSSKEQYGRLRTWGEQTKAVLPAKARYSLDETLREDGDMRAVVSSSLRRLYAQIGRSTNQLQAERFKNSIGHQGNLSSSSDDSDSTSELGIDPSVRIVQRDLRSIFEEIRSLYRVSALLKRPRVTNKFLRSRNKRYPFYRLSSSPDYAHISEKVRQWRGLKAIQPVREYEEAAVTMEDIEMRDKYPDQDLKDIHFLCERLCWANILRRDQLTYWKGSPVMPDVAKAESRDIIHGEPISQQPRLEVLKEQDENIKTAGSSSKSQVTARTVSSIAASALYETKTESRLAGTTYADTLKGGQQSGRVPKVPADSDQGPSFTCPFCHADLDSEQMQNRTVRKYVFRDLRPYVCTFEAYQNVERLFVPRHDWAYHEQQMHRRKWVCSEGCAESFTTKIEMIQHLQHCHVEYPNRNRRQVATMADLCERAIDTGDPSTCRLCLKVMDLSMLQIHLADHMEEIALFVFPTDVGDSGDELDSLKSSSITSWTSQHASIHPKNAHPAADESGGTVRQESTDWLEDFQEWGDARLKDLVDYASNEDLAGSATNPDQAYQTQQSETYSTSIQLSPTVEVQSALSAARTANREIRRGGRKSGLDYHTREKVDQTRNFRECWVCAIQRDKCDSGKPCGRCLIRSQRGKMHLLPCVRTHLSELTPRFLPPCLTELYTREKVIDYVSQVVSRWTDNSIDVDLTCEGLGSFRQTLHEFEPSQNLLNKNSPGFLPLAMKSLSDDSTEIEGYVDGIINGCLDSFQVICFGAGEVRAKLLISLCELYRNIAGQATKENLKGDVRQVIATLVLLYILQKRITIVYEVQDDIVEKMRRQSESNLPAAPYSPEVAQRQCKVIVSTMSTHNFDQCLRRLHLILRSAQDKSKRWISSFVLMLGIALAGEMSQKLTRATSRARAEVHRDCRRIEDAYEFLCKLYHVKYRGRHRQLTRFSEWASKTKDSAEQDFVRRVSEIVDEEADNILRDHTGSGSMPEGQGHSGKPLAIFLVDLFALNYGAP